MRKKILLSFTLIFFIINIKTVFATSIVSVEVKDVYKITGETVNEIPRYIMDLEKTGTEHGEKNLTIFNRNFPFDWNYRNIRIKNSSDDDYSIWLKKASSSLIEQGPDRAYVRYENTSSSYGNSADCWISPEVVCWNFTADYYVYPRYYWVYFKLWGNFSGIVMETFSIPYRFGYYQFNNSASYYNNGTYQGANNVSQMYDYFNKSIVFLYNTTGHNKTFALFSLAPNNFSYIPKWYFYNNIPYNTMLNMIYSWGLPDSGKSFYWGYGLLFSDSGNRSLEENYTVWLGFKDQWFDIYYPASISTITGSYLGRDNITGTYNFTVDSSGLLRFNFSTGNVKHFLPVFHIKDTTSTASSYKEHIWYKNYSSSNNWQKLNNWTDFVIQDGNSTYFGYNYILLLINKTLGSDYEFWISNSSDPAGVITRKIINWNKTLLIWNDTNATSAFTLRYEINGLKPNAYYNVYNNSVLTYSMLQTDSQGNLPSFTIYLSGEHEIKVEEYPVVSVILSDELVKGIFFTNRTGAEQNVQYNVDVNNWNNATWNYNASDSKTEYWIKNNGTTSIDVCQKATSNMVCQDEWCGSYQIYIGNVSWSNSTLNDASNPSFSTLYPLTLSYSGNRSAYNLELSTSIYLRFFFFVPPYVPSGRYNSSIVFKAVKAGDPC